MPVTAKEGGNFGDAHFPAVSRGDGFTATLPLYTRRNTIIRDILYLHVSGVTSYTVRKRRVTFEYCVSDLRNRPPYDNVVRYIFSNNNNNNNSDITIRK